MHSIDILNIGYGSAAILQSTDFCAIIDCKAPDAGTDQVDLQMHIHRNPVDLLILTHQHRDHWNGVSGLLDNDIAFEHCWVTPYLPQQGELHFNADDQTAYEALLERLSQQGTQIETVSRDRLPLQRETITLTVLNPPNDIMGMQERQVHDGCIVIRCDTPCGTVLFGSDATNAAWRRIADWNAALLRADYFIASHHGADDGIDAEILQRIQPRIILLSTEEGQYPDTPHPDVLALFQQCVGDNLLRTDKHGTLTILETGVIRQNDSDN
jgi:beta-lactamase superfamily II metal-dependent hydrolase